MEWRPCYCWEHRKRASDYMLLLVYIIPNFAYRETSSQREEEKRISVRRQCDSLQRDNKIVTDATVTYKRALMAQAINIHKNKFSRHRKKTDRKTEWGSNAVRKPFYLSIVYVSFGLALERYWNAIWCQWYPMLISTIDRKRKGIHCKYNSKIKSNGI